MFGCGEGAIIDGSGRPVFSEVIASPNPVKAGAISVVTFKVESGDGGFIHAVCWWALLTNPAGAQLNVRSGVARPFEPVELKLATKKPTTVSVQIFGTENQNECAVSAQISSDVSIKVQH